MAGTRHYRIYQAGGAEQDRVAARGTREALAYFAATSGLRGSIQQTRVGLMFKADDGRSFYARFG